MTTITVIGGTGYAGANIVAEAVEGVDVVIGALSPRGELEGRILEAYRGVVALAKSPEDRLIVGGFAPGERTGSYRTGGGIALESEAGPLAISGADFAIAIVDEAESGAHSREHISFAS